jgi:hypothetical protein
VKQRCPWSSLRAANEVIFRRFGFSPFWLGDCFSSTNLIKALKREGTIQ